MIYTSYFGQIKNMPDNFEPICIARWKPKWYTGKALLMLAPPDMLLQWWRASDKTEQDQTKYTKLYLEYLTKTTTPKAIESILTTICKNKTPILLSFENPDEFSHRQILSKWLNYHHINCKEWTKS